MSVLQNLRCICQMAIMAFEVRTNLLWRIAPRLGTKVMSDLKSDQTFIRFVSSSSQADCAATYVLKEAGLLCLSSLSQIGAGVSLDRAVPGEGM